MNSVKTFDTKLGALSISILVLSGVVLIFSFLAPSIFVQPTRTGIDFSKTGQIGDTIGGLMNPFIAIAGVLLTFLAFFIQFRANKLQQSSFREELNEQKIQFRKSQFENQFYEMLRLHKENVNDLQISIRKLIRLSMSEKEPLEEIIKGRKTFDYFIKELELCYYIAKKSFKESDYKVWLNEAYGIIYHGLNNELITKHEYFKILSDIQQAHERNNYSTLSTIVRSKFPTNDDFDLQYPIFKGYSSLLGHYYRHRFQTVKFVVSQDEELVTYENKRKYLRILRAQLSNQEQAMLFYNWFSNFGRQWENNTNRFFTDYRMIHNIYPQLIIPDLHIEEIFDFNGNFRKESGRVKDPLFEYQDWEKSASG